MAARGSAGDGALRRAAEQWLLWDKVRGGWAGGDGGARCRGVRGRGVTPGCCIVPDWGALKAPVCSLGSAFRAL